MCVIVHQGSWSITVVRHHSGDSFFNRVTGNTPRLKARDDFSLSLSELVKG
jgi:hypothetical protein